MPADLSDREALRRKRRRFQFRLRTLFAIVNLASRNRSRRVLNHLTPAVARLIGLAAIATRRR
jgi:hypothetical protein